MVPSLKQDSQRTPFSLHIGQAHFRAATSSKPLPSKIIRADFCNCPSIDVIKHDHATKELYTGSFRDDVVVELNFSKISSKKIADKSGLVITWRLLFGQTK